MPYEKSGWTISAGYRGGVIQGPGGETIYFGTHHDLSKTANRVDLRHMSHGMDDTADKCIPCFIAAADIIHSELQTRDSATVHCANGNSRTSFALIAYLCRYAGFTIEDAGTFLTKGQAERTDITFSLTKQVNNNSYWGWLNEAKWSEIVTDASRGTDYRAMYSVSGPSKSGNKVHHAVQTNISRGIPSAHAVEDDDSSSSSDSVHYSYGMRIRESEVRELKKNAAVYMGYKY